MLFDPKDLSLKIPPPFEEALLGFFWKGDLPDSRSIQNQAKHLKVLWQELSKTRGQNTNPDEHYSMSKPVAETYASYYLPVNFLKLSMVLKERQVLFPEQTERLAGKVWMDLGCGPGTALWGLHHFFQQQDRKSEFEYVGVDQSRNFLSLARNLADGLSVSLREKSQKIFFEQAAHLKQVAALLEKHRPDVLTLMNSFGELYPNLEKKMEFFEILKNYARKNKDFLVIVIEPSSKNASREILEWREKISKVTSVRIQQPCLDNRHCGALDLSSDWCHEDVEVQYPDWFCEFGAQAGLVKESLLFSYLVFDFMGSDIRVEPRVAQTQGSLLTECRVVSQRMKTKGITACFLCSKQGRFKARVLDSKVNADNEAFQNIRRGQILNEVELSEKGDVITMSSK